MSPVIGCLDHPFVAPEDTDVHGRRPLPASKPKVLSYTLEWGSGNNPTPFHPPYPEMKNIIQEITAAVVRFCVEVLGGRAQGRGRL